MLLGDLHSETLRVQIMDLLPAEWLHRAVADTVYARRIHSYAIISISRITR